MRLVYCVITCDGLGGSIACAWNSPEQSDGFQLIQNSCSIGSTMKMSSFPLEIEKNIQAMESYRFLQ